MQTEPTCNAVTRRRYPAWLAHVFLLVVALLPGTALGIEYRVTGTVSAYVYYDQANPTQMSICDFVWWRKMENWRLDFRMPSEEHPPPGVWRSIFPLTDGELISIHSFPPRPGVAKSEGNVYVSTLDTPGLGIPILPAQNIYGEHVVWMFFNTREILTMAGPLGECQPFFLFDEAVNTLPYKSHLLIQTDNGLAFFNTGLSFVRDKDNEVIWEGGAPKLLPLPPPYEKGFKEVEIQFANSMLDESNAIPSRAVLTYFQALPDTAGPKGFRLETNFQYLVEAVSFELLHIDDSKFSPSWTNSLSLVLPPASATLNNEDSRVHVSRSTNYSQALESMERYELALRRKPGDPAKAWLVLAIGMIIVGPLLLWLLLRINKHH